MFLVFMRYFFLCGFLALASCQWLPEPIKTEVKPYFPILSPVSLGQSLVVMQLISSERGGHRYKILFQVEVEPGRLAMVGSTTGGNTLFSLLYENNKLNAEVSPLLPAGIDPAFVLADFQLTYWPIEEVNSALKDSDFKVRVLNNSRQLYKNDQLVATVKYSHLNPWKGIATVHNLYWGYQYKIETLTTEVLVQQ